MSDETICSVVGAGRMGTGIAHALLLTGAQVYLSDADRQRVDTAADRVRTMVRATAERGRLDGDPDEVCARLYPVVGTAELGGDLVLEAVPELPELKIELFAALERIIGPDALIASNTSSISIDQLAAHLERPERFLGLHFFNPVPASRLVEVVVGSRTDEEHVTRASALVAAMDKTAIVVRDSPGFASSRLGLAIGLEAIRMVEDGVASAQDIDAAMTLGYKHPLGPLRLTDMVGLDVRLGIAEYLAEALGPRFEPPELLRNMVARGELGQKSGQGFYAWPS